jgi:hypothetical protein
LELATKLRQAKKMNTTNQVIASVGSAVLVSLFCYGVWGLEGAIFGFLGVLLLIGLFKIWMWEDAGKILHNEM